MIEPTIRQLQISMLLGVALMITVLALVAGAGVAVTVGASERISSRLLPAREANAALLRNMLDRETGVRVYLVQSEAGNLSRYADATTEQPQREAQLRRLVASEDDLLPMVRAQERATRRWTQQFALPALSGQRAAVNTEAGLAMGDRLIHEIRETNGRLSQRLSQSIASDRDRADRATTQMAVVLARRGAGVFEVAHALLMRPFSACASMRRCPSIRVIGSTTIMVAAMTTPSRRCRARRVGAAAPSRARSASAARAPDGCPWPGRERRRRRRRRSRGKPR